MKKQLISICTVLVFVLSLSVSAFAVAPQYKSTEAFIKMMDENQYEYDFFDADEADGDEMIIADFEGEYLDNIEVTAFFPDTEDEMFLYSFDVIKYAQSDYSKVLEAVNQLNNENNYVCFYVEKDEKAVSAVWSVLLGEKDTKEIADIAFHTFLTVVDDSYKVLKPLEN
jgi:hypothetical protein